MPSVARADEGPSPYAPQCSSATAHGFAEAAGGFEGVAVFAVAGGDVGAGEQQPLAVGALVLAVILQQALRDFLVVRVVAEARRHQCQPLHQQRAVGAAVEIGLGPGHRLRGVERRHRFFEPADDLGAGHPFGIAGGALTGSALVQPMCFWFHAA